MSASFKDQDPLITEEEYLKGELTSEIKHEYQEYVLIEQDFVDVEVCRRSEGWVSNHYFMGDEVTFESIGLTVPVEEIYARVENEDVRLYFEEKQAVLAESPSELSSPG